MNTEERQLAEMLHRVTPEPPRQVTMEDVAFRLASEAGQARGGHREARARRGLGRPRGRGWAPVLAAASVVVVAGASAGIAQRGLAPQPCHRRRGPDRARPRLGFDSAVLGGAVAADGVGRADLAAGADRRRDVGRGADQPPVVHPGLAGSGSGVSSLYAVSPGLPGPDRPGHRANRCRRSRTPRRPVPEPAGRHRGTRSGWCRPTAAATWCCAATTPGRSPRSRRCRCPPSAGCPARLRGCWPADTTAASTWPQATPWRWWTRPAATGDAADLPDRRRGQLGGGRARREQAVRGSRPCGSFQLLAYDLATGVQAGLVVQDGRRQRRGTWSRPRAVSGARPASG